MLWNWHLCSLTSAQMELKKKKIVCMKKAQKAVESLYLHFFLKILAVQGIQQLKNAEEYLSLLYKLLKTIDMDRCYR